MNNPLNQPERTTTNANTDVEIRLKKAMFRSHHRGCKEMDLVMGQFASRHLSNISTEMLETYEQLLDEEDAILMDWMLNRAEPDTKYQTLVAMLKQYTPAHEALTPKQ